MTKPDPLRELDARQLRKRIRAGQMRGFTAGYAPRQMQANLVVLAAEHAADFKAFCAANPKPCPLLAVSEPGDPGLPALGQGIDLRSDLPGYRLWRDGALVAELDDVTEHWRDDLVAFALGCSFGFETALIEAGIALPHVDAGRNVAMFDTALPLAEVGPFGGTMVVSMRRIPEGRLDDAVAISGRFPQCHGAPVHIGDPAAIGIATLDRPDYGDPVEGDGVPVFWACGVTPQAVLRRAWLPFSITHSPGKMLVCDVPATWDRILNAEP